MSLAQSRIDRDNLAVEDDLIRKKSQLVSQATAWMASAITLHGSVSAEDKQQILDLKAALVAELSAVLV